MMVVRDWTKFPTTHLINNIYTVRTKSMTRNTIVISNLEFFIDFIRHLLKSISFNMFLMMNILSFSFIMNFSKMTFSISVLFV